MGLRLVCALLCSRKVDVVVVTTCSSRPHLLSLAIFFMSLRPD